MARHPASGSAYFHSWDFPALYRHDADRVRDLIRRHQGDLRGPPSDATRRNLEAAYRVAADLGATFGPRWSLWEEPGPR